MQHVPIIHQGTSLLWLITAILIFISIISKRPRGKDNTKHKKRKRTFLPKKKLRDRRTKGTKHRRKLNWNVSAIKYIFLDQKRITICEHTPSLPCVHIPLLSSDQKELCEGRNVSINLPCVYACLSSGDLFFFRLRVSSLFSYCCGIYVTMR